jgi:glycosyltransferase involved in cell wall biosynthesis
VDPDLAIVVTASEEAERRPVTLAALERAFPGARRIVADDGSRDATGAAARAAGAEVVVAPRRVGKGTAATLAARRLLEAPGPRPRLLLLCDADLGASAAELRPLTSPLEREEADLVVGAFERRSGRGLGLVVRTARLAVLRATGVQPRAPLSGQRALRVSELPVLLPFAHGFGMEVGMTIEAHRAGLRIAEHEHPLHHLPTGLTPAGFGHRGRQLADVIRAVLARRPLRPRRRAGPTTAPSPRRAGR